MKNKELHNSFSEEVKQNPAKCKTQEEVKKGPEEADERHLDDEVLEAVAGGISQDYHNDLRGRPF